MHGRGSRVCVAGGMHGRGSGMHGRGCGWQGACVVGHGMQNPPVGRILDTHLWKHYPSSNFVAGGNNTLDIPEIHDTDKENKPQLVFFLKKR